MPTFTLRDYQQEAIAAPIHESGKGLVPRCGKRVAGKFPGGIFCGDTRVFGIDSIGACRPYDPCSRVIN